MSALVVEEVDLATLVEAIRERVDSTLTGFVLGRTRMRDAVVEHLGCSELEAERLVDTIVARGFARLSKDEDGRELWRLSDPT